MSKIKVLTVFGTRPEAIKMSPLVLELQKYSDDIESLVCITAQHRQMLDQVMDIFDIKADFDLDIMEDSQTLCKITTKALAGLDDVLTKCKPDLVLVHGDTTTTFVGSLASFYHKIPVGHVEAGLRTFDKYSPYPEEVNRLLTGTIADLHFAPTVNNANNLRAEKKSGNIYITGNTVIDSLKETVKKDYIFAENTLNSIDFNAKKVILLTAHRRENYGEPFMNILDAVLEIATKNEDVLFVYPVHLSPYIKDNASQKLGNIPNILLVSPINVADMHNLMARAYMIMTDSGGIQEEAPSLGKPVLVLRTETERPEAVLAGTVKVTGVLKDDIVNEALTLLNSPIAYEKMSKSANPYGDGLASNRIVLSILHHFGKIKDKPSDFGL